MKLSLGRAHISNLNIRKQSNGDDRINAVDVKVKTKLTTDQLAEITEWDNAVIDGMFHKESGLSVYQKIGMTTLEREFEPISAAICDVDLDYAKVNKISVGLWAVDCIECVFRIQAANVSADTIGKLATYVDEDLQIEMNSMQSEIQYEKAG